MPQTTKDTTHAPIDARPAVLLARAAGSDAGRGRLLLALAATTRVARPAGRGTWLWTAGLMAGALAAVLLLR